MKKTLLLVITLLFSFCIYAQSDCDKYLQNAYSAYNAGEKGKAEILYNVYKNCTGKTDVNFEALLRQNANTSSSSHSNIKTITVNGVSFDMVWVEGGTFQMGSNNGSNNEKPVHSVTLDGYYIGKYEVTQALWQAVMGTSVSEQRNKVSSSWSLDGVGDNYPMYYISWEECDMFVQRLSYLTGKKFSLPTEAQWEYAARGGNKSKGYTYSGGNVIDYLAWYKGNSGDKTHPVGQKFPNELGIYDMSGNVWEWCSDWYDSGYYSKSSLRNPVNTSSTSSRVYRGGSWCYYAEYCRVADRDYNNPTIRNGILGVRLVLLP